MKTESQMISATFKIAAADTSRRIAMLRALMIFGIVVLHTPLYVAMADTGTGTFDFIKAFFQSAFFRCSVPILTCISGYLLMASKQISYKDLVCKKAKTLLVPFMVFNFTVAVAALFTMSKDAHILDSFLALTAMPTNYPLMFLRDLFVIILMTPIFKAMLDSRYSGLSLFVVFMVFHLNLDGNIIIRNEMPPLFYLGALAAYKKWDMAKFDVAAPFLAILFISICGWYVSHRMGNTTVLRMASPFMLWPASSLLLDTKLGMLLERYSKYSFFVFLTHAPVLAVVYAGYKAVGSMIPYPVFWLLCPVVICAALIYAHDVALKMIGKPFAFVTGGKAA